MSDPNWKPESFIDTVPNKALWQPFVEFDEDAEVPSDAADVSAGELLLVAAIAVAALALFVVAGWPT